MPLNLEENRPQFYFASIFFKLNFPFVKPVLILQGEKHFPRWVVSRHSSLMKDYDFV